MYDAIGYLEKDLLEITAQDFLKVVEAHARDGVDFMTIHAVLTAVRLKPSGAEVSGEDPSPAAARCCSHG